MIKFHNHKQHTTNQICNFGCIVLQVYHCGLCLMFIFVGCLSVFGVYFCALSLWVVFEVYLIEEKNS